MTTFDVPFPPDPNPRKPRLVAPPGSWDTHFHVYGPPNRFPYAERRGFTPPAAPFEHWQRTSAAIGIERGVLVTPGIHDLDPAVTLDAIQRSEGRIRGMIRANAKLSKAEIAALHAAGIRGMRFPFAAELGKTFDAEVVRANLALIESENWVAAFQIDGNTLVEQADLIGALPLPTVLDGLGGIVPALGVEQPAFRTLLDLLKRPGFYVKMSGHDRDLKNGQRYGDLVAIFRAIIMKAPNQVIWGSDWPHSYIYEANGVPNDGDLIDMLLDFAPDEAVRAKILVDNPQRLFDT